MSELWSRPLTLALVLLGLVGWIVWRPRQGEPARAWNLFRCLLPSWRFFDRVDVVPALHYRAACHGDDWSDWQNALPVPTRTVGSLWLNAAGNLHLACQSLVEHLVAELADAGELGEVGHELVSYRLVCALIEQRLRTELPSSPELRYQFRLVEAEPADSPLFLSRVHGSG